MELLFFTDRCQVYKAKVSDFADTKASVMGDYIPARLSMDEGENAQYMVALKKYSGYMLFFFENGKAAKVDMAAYETKTNRKSWWALIQTNLPLWLCIIFPKMESSCLRTPRGAFFWCIRSDSRQKHTFYPRCAGYDTAENGRVVKVELYEEGRLKIQPIQKEYTGIRFPSRRGGNRGRPDDPVNVES